MLARKTPLQIVRRVFCMGLAVVFGFSIIFAVSMFLLQEKMIYHGQAYAIDLGRVRKDGLLPVSFETSMGQQTALYIPPKGHPDGVPERIWMMFHGNAALALDWLDLLEKSPDGKAGFLLVDYPGYGHCEGKPSPKAILETSEKAMGALAGELKTTPDKLFRHLSMVGYSLGCAAALQLAARHEVERLILVSPFTSMTEMARRTVGWPICLMLTHRFDNRTALATLAARAVRPAVTIIHGDADDLVPVTMSRELARRYAGWIDYHEIHGADHFILDAAEPLIVKAMGPEAVRTAKADGK